MKYSFIIFQLFLIIFVNSIIPQKQLLPIYQIYKSQIITYSTRLHPKSDIMFSLLSIANQSKFQAVSILSSVGSVLYCSLRFANNSYLTPIQGPLQIVSLSGTIDQNQNPHIHISIADGNGRVYGGHLPSLKEQRSTEFDSSCPIFTTLQIVLGEYKNIVYTRKIDPETTFDELTISKRKWL